MGWFPASATVDAERRGQRRAPEHSAEV